MNTGQESTNGHCVFPPPFSVENRADLPTDKADNNQNQFVNHAPVVAASAYHVPPKPFTPNPKLDQPNDYSERAKRLEPLPERCQFMFSDGRQCTMARSDIHPSLCRFHSEREDQLFGDPAPGGAVVGRGLDLPELYSACRDLTTAAGVNRALGQVFRLLAQRRISRQEAATFAKLGHLLLQTIRAARSSRESHGDQELSRVNKVAVADPLDVTRQDADSGVIPSEGSEPRISPEPLPERTISSPPSPPSQPLTSSKNEVEPPPRGFVMKADPERDAPAIFCRPTTPLMPEERFVISGCTRGGSPSPENQHVQKITSQLAQNEHLQNLRT